jgi:DNA polymerase-1
VAPGPVINTLQFPKLEGQYVFADVETTGLNWWSDSIFGVALRVNGNSFYWDVRTVPETLKWLRGELPRAAVFDNHNTKFDLHFLREAGIAVELIPQVRCTMVDAALVNEHEFSYDLDHLSQKYLKAGKDSGLIEAGRALLGKRATIRTVKANMARLPAHVVGTYATVDVELAELLRLNYLGPQIEQQDISRIVALERDLLPVLVRMEERGVRVDVRRAEQASEEIGHRITAAQRRINILAGRDLNINSPKQLREYFVPENRGTDPKKPEWYVTVAGRGIRIGTTDAGQPSIDKDTLRVLPGDMPKLILELRKLDRTKNTFIDGHILGHHVDGIVHTNFNQTKGDNEMGTGTGRLSANAPALQQIHKRNAEIASLVRAMFIPYERQMWISADWDQKEFRWFAHYTKNPVLLARYAANPQTDFHQAVSDLTALPRNPVDGVKGNAKQINLGLVFGMGMGRLAQEMGLPYEEVTRRNKTWLVPGPEAEAIFSQYHEAVPGVKELLETASSVARSRGFVQTAGGRHIRFPGGNYTHKAAGLIFQGTSADCMKYKLIEHDKEWAGTDVYPVLSVHDEIDFSAPDDPAIVKRIKEINECFDGVGCPIKCRVPILCSVTMADNWWEASK